MNKTQVWHAQFRLQWKVPLRMIVVPPTYWYSYIANIFFVMKVIRQKPYVDDPAANDPAVRWWPYGTKPWTIGEAVMFAVGLMFWIFGGFYLIERHARKLAESKVESFRASAEFWEAKAKRLFVESYDETAR